MTKTQGFVRSSVRTHINNEIFLIMYWMETIFTHVSAHVGVEGSERVDILAKQSLRVKVTDLRVLSSKTEAITSTWTYIQYLSMAGALG